MPTMKPISKYFASYQRAAIKISRSVDSKNLTASILTRRTTRGEYCYMLSMGLEHKVSRQHRSFRALMKVKIGFFCVTEQKCLLLTRQIFSQRAALMSLVHCSSAISWGHGEGDCWYYRYMAVKSNYQNWAFDYFQEPGCLAHLTALLLFDCWLKVGSLATSPTVSSRKTTNAARNYAINSCYFGAS